MDLSSSSFLASRPSMGFGGVGLRGSSSASNLSLLREDPVGTSKVVSLLRTPLISDLSTHTSGSSFQTTGISDLRAATVAQQRQLDGIVDKVAALVASMHADVIRDMHRTFERNSGEVSVRLEELRRAGPELDRRLQELREGEGGLQAWLQNELRAAVAHSEDEIERSRERIFAEFEDLSNRVLGEVQTLRELLSEEGNALQASLAREMHDVRIRLETLEQSALDSEAAALRSEGWQEALEHSGHELREELHRVILETTEPIAERVLTLEERVVPACDQLLKASPSQLQRLEQANERISLMEADARRHEAELERLEEEVQWLRQAESSARDADVQACEWQRRAEEKLGALAAAESRLSLLEQWRKRAEERLDRPATQLVPLQDRLASAEQRVEAVQQRLDSVTAARPTDAACAARCADLERRLDELNTSSNSLNVSATNECFHMERRIRDQMDALGTRTRSAESACEAVRQQFGEMKSELRTMSVLARTESRLESRASRNSVGTEDLEHALRSQLSRMQGELRRDMEAQLAQTHNSSQRVCDDLRREIDLRAAQAQMEAQKSADEFRRDVDSRLAQLSSSSQKLASELRQEIETAAAARARAIPQKQESFHDHAAVQKLTNDLESGLQEVKALRAGLEGARSFADETQRQVCELRGAFSRPPESSRSAAVKAAAREAAREAADDAVSTLRMNIQRDVADRLERCDAAAASCERCARAAEERLRKIANDLQAQIAACEGAEGLGGLLDWPPADIRTMTPTGYNNVPLLVSPSHAAGRVGTPLHSGGLAGRGSGPLPTDTVIGGPGANL